jgi:cytochrome c oxidase assembly factor CtaG
VEPNLAFYEVAAQVIPVLVLALVVQERAEKGAANPSPRFELFLLGCVALAAAGEIISVSALIEEKAPAAPAKWAVLGGIVVPFLPFLMSLARPSVETIGGAYPQLRPIGRFLAWGLPIAALALGFTRLDAAPVFGGFAILFYIGVTGAATFLKPAKTQQADSPSKPKHEDCNGPDP